MDSIIPLLFQSKISSLKPSVFVARFVEDLYGNHIVSFPTKRLSFNSWYIYEKDAYADGGHCCFQNALMIFIMEWLISYHDPCLKYCGNLYMYIYMETTELLR